MLLLYPFASYDQILTENVTHKVSITWLKTLAGKINLHMRLHFQIKQKFVIFQFLQCYKGLLFFLTSPYTLKFVPDPMEAGGRSLSSIESVINTL